MKNKQLEIYDRAKLEEGTKEWNPGSNPKIGDYHASTSFGRHSDEFPWCSSFVNWCCQQVGIKGTGSAAARSWLKWGEEITKPQVGDIVVMQRGTSKSQAHVGFFEGEHQSMKEIIKVYGGNQGDEACSKWVQRSHVLAYRRFKET